MPGEDGAAFLQTQVVDRGEGLFKDLRGHDRRADGEEEAVLHSGDGVGKDLKVLVAGAAQGGSIGQGVVVDDVITDAAVHGDGQPETEGLPEEGVCLVRMADGDQAALQAGRAHRCEQFGPGGGERVAFAQILLEFLFESGDFGKKESIFRNHRTHRLAIAHAAQGIDLHRQIEPAAGLVPGAETALGDIGADILLRTALVGEFPVMDGAGAVGGEMGYPAPLHHPDHQRSGAVLDQMGPEGHYHAGAVSARRKQAPGGLADQAGDLRGGRRLLLRIHGGLPDGGFTHPLRQGKDTNSLGFKSGVGHGHSSFAKHKVMVFIDYVKTFFYCVVSFMCVN